MAAYEQNNTSAEPARTDSRQAPSERGGGFRSDRGGGPRFQRRDNRRRIRVCQFCVEKATAISYRDVPLLRQYVSEAGRILSRRRTGMCAKHQRMLARAIKRARQIALLPYTAVHSRQLGS